MLLRNGFKRRLNLAISGRAQGMNLQTHSARRFLRVPQLALV
jgi:hypothetical protein